MAAERSLPAPSLAPRRDATIAKLCEHFAHDHIEAGELERRIDRAHQAATAADLEALLTGLPALREPAPRPDPAGLSAPVGGQQTIVAIMGGAERRGAWAPARRLYVVAVMGGIVLDFRDVELTPGVTEVSVLAIMGGVEIIVPPGLTVESNGMGIMGGFGHGGRARFPVDRAASVLRVDGLALMGGVEIKEKPRRALAGAEADPNRGGGKG